MSDAEWVKAVAKMTPAELFAQVMASPEFLTDGYYRDLGDALRKRYAELTTDAKPAAWLVDVAEHQNQYAVVDANDAQLLDDCTNHGATVTPLYAAAPLPAREPLPFDQLVRMIPQYPPTGMDIINFGRAIEAAHDIKAAL